MKSSNPALAFLLRLLLPAALILPACSGLGAPAEPTAAPAQVEDFPNVVSATGVVVPAASATLSMQTGGVVAELLVEQDQAVQAGETLLRLQGSEALQAAISAANMEVTLAQQALEDLYDDPELHLSQAQKTLADAEQAVDDAQKRLNNLQAASKQSDIDQARANVILALDRLEEAREDYAPYENKAETNTTRAALLSRMAQAQKEYDAAVRLLNNLLGKANPLDLQEAQANLLLAQARLDTARREYETLQAGPDPELVRLAEARLENAQAQLKAALAALENLELQAPFEGTIAERYVQQSEWVAPGQPVLLMADLAHLRVETTDLNEIDSAQIGVGYTAKVTFDALPGVAVDGKVIRIAPKASPGAGVNYTLVIELAQVPEKIRWGMTAFVDIVTGQESP